MTVAAAAAAIVEDDLGATALGCGCLDKLRTMNKYRTIDFVGKVSRIGNNSSRKDGRVLRSIGENNVAVVALSKDNKRYLLLYSPVILRTRGLLVNYYLTIMEQYSYLD